MRSTSGQYRVIEKTIIVSALSLFIMVLLLPVQPSLIRLFNAYQTIPHVQVGNLQRDVSV